MQGVSTSHLRDVKAAGEDVRRDQDLRSAAPKLLHGAVSLFVIQLARYAGASVTFCLQLQTAADGGPFPLDVSARFHMLSAFSSQRDHMRALVMLEHFEEFQHCR